MELTILGSGTCAVTPKRGASSYLLKTKKVKLLLDCGSGIIRQLTKAGESYQDIDIVCLSHFHPDHANDLIFLIQAIENTPGFKRKKPLYILGAKGTKKFVKETLALFRLGVIKSRKYGLKIYELNKRRSILEISFEAKKGNHSDHSIIIKLKVGNKTLVYSGDTDWDNRIPQFAKKADLLILEASWPNKYEHKPEIRKTHLTPKMAVKLANLATAKKVLLTHFYPVYQKGQIKKEAKNKNFKGKLLIAKDLMRIKV